MRTAITTDGPFRMRYSEEPAVVMHIGERCVGQWLEDALGYDANTETPKGAWCRLTIEMWPDGKPGEEGG